MFLLKLKKGDLRQYLHAFSIFSYLIQKRFGFSKKCIIQPSPNPSANIAKDQSINADNQSARIGAFDHARRYRNQHPDVRISESYPHIEQKRDQTPSATENAGR